MSNKLPELTLAVPVTCTGQFGQAKSDGKWYFQVTVVQNGQGAGGQSSTHQGGPYNTRALAITDLTAALTNSIA